MKTNTQELPDALTRPSVRASQMDAAGETAGYSPTVQSDGSIDYAAKPTVDTPTIVNQLAVYKDTDGNLDNNASVGYTTTSGQATLQSLGVLDLYLKTTSASRTVVIGQTGDGEISDGTVSPVNDEGVNLGSSSKRYQQVHATEFFLGAITADVSATPTDAELDSNFGDAGTLGDNFIGIVDDNNAQNNVWIVVTRGGTWQGVQLQTL